MAGNPLSDPNWPAQAADHLVRIVDQIRARTTRPIVLIARGLVFGIIALLGGMVALLLFLVAFTKGLQAILEWPLDHPKAVWVSYLLLGGLLLIAGMVAMAKRHPKADA